MEAVTNLPLELSPQPFATYDLLIDGLTSPVAFVHSGGNRFYIVDQIGYVYIYDQDRPGPVRIQKGVGTVYGNQVQSPLVDISGIITPLNEKYDERGLLQMILSPQRDLFYLYYTINLPQGSDYNCLAILEEWILEGDTARPIRPIVQWPHPEANHFGSPIGFDSNGLFYFGTGDGGGAGDNHGPIGNAHDLTSPWGKILSIDLNSSQPTVNIVAIGFRNPWRGSFTFDGAIIIGDVGQNHFEGVHLVRPNEDHGWRAYENGHIYDQDLALKLPQITPPILWYEQALGRAIIGGYQLNENKDYLFGDYTGSNYGDNVYLIRNGRFLIQNKTQDHFKFSGAEGSFEFKIRKPLASEFLNS